MTYKCKIITDDTKFALQNSVNNFYKDNTNIIVVSTSYAFMIGVHTMAITYYIPSDIPFHN